tara:strand:+ start:109 stop:912 length:804 start_codon:yes stop_codon:yes gene_type:complete
MHHLVSINDLKDEFIEILFNRTSILKKELPSMYKDSLRGKILTNLFYEPSTRTSSSFHAAMLKLGGEVLSINEITYSSVSKGENLQDTIRTMGCYSDIIVLRSQNDGDAKLAAKVSEVPIINAGDGKGEHPTQTLLDLYTIYENFGRIKNLTITFIGDIVNGRTVHSLAKALEKKCVINYCSTYDVDKLPKSDVYYLTRVQKERGSTGSYQLTKDHVKEMPNKCIVMHPFPRNEEIPRWFDNDPRAKYFDQMKNGLYMRMAILMTYK